MPHEMFFAKSIFQERILIAFVQLYARGSNRLHHLSIQGLETANPLCRLNFDSPSLEYG
jgi:hypothetical protein